MKKICKRVLCLLLALSLLNIHPVAKTAAAESLMSQVTYDEMTVENNANANDYVRFKNLKYVLAEDKSSNCVVTLYKMI